jgi:demethylmenaquinone methyltransferase/2-methoxy-6-polyprenyl-1,4-benzoquinol methylase
MASTLTCVDASPEMIALNHARLTAAGYPNVRYVEADLFAWRPEAQYDVVFFSFWLSHVPDNLFDSFWAMVSQALRSNGRAFLIDSLAAESSAARDQTIGVTDGMQERQLNDGRFFRVFKRYWGAKELSRRLEQLSWTARLHDTATYFVYGSTWPSV